MRGTAGKRFLVFGAGLSGIAAAELLHKKGEAFALYEGGTKQSEEEIREKSPALREAAIFVGDLPEEEISGTDILIISPGIPVDSSLVERFRKEGAAVWGEIELAYQYTDPEARILAITGTNGKTTTTTLLGEIMRASYEDVAIVGNIGIPYTKIAADTKPGTIIVAEISSFQLETIHEFAPEVSAILNITPDHLDRHHTMEAYQEAKESITKNQKAAQTCVLNYEDEVLRDFGEALSAQDKVQVLWFSSAHKLPKGLYIDREAIFYSAGAKVTKICGIEELQILGRHNYENVMAACGMALSFGVDIKALRESLLRFTGVEHRIEYVETVGGIRYYNDSKATNPDAAIQGIKAMQWPTILIAGGYDKGAEYGEWIQAFDGKVKKLVLLGVTAEKIAAQAKELGFPQEDLIFAESMEEAVKTCFTSAQPGDVVLLSPACASWGMFANYEERGRIFKELVRGLKGS